VFGGFIGLKELPQADDQYVACFYMADVDELVWCAAGDGVGISYTATFDPADSLEDGPRDPESTPASWTVVESSGNFSDKSGGVDDEFGQEYYAEKK
jgi:hypothetical protein